MIQIQKLNRYLYQKIVCAKNKKLRPKIDNETKMQTDANR